MYFDLCDFFFVLEVVCGGLTAFLWSGAFLVNGLEFLLELLESVIAKLVDNSRVIGIIHKLDILFQQIGNSLLFPLGIFMMPYILLHGEDSIVAYLRYYL